MTLVNKGRNDLDSCISVIGTSGHFALALLAVATHCNAKRSPKTFKMALEKVGLSREAALSGVATLVPFFAAATDEIERFNNKLLKG